MSATHSAYFALRIGDRYGRFNEEIMRLEQRHAGDARPAWFDPINHEGHLGITEGHDALYMELAIDDDARYADHAFAEVEAESVHIVQTSLF
jgi:hypothetical protein